MLVRRCSVLYLEPRERLDFDLGVLFAGEQALAASIDWIALAPHLGREVQLSAQDVLVLGRIGETLWQEHALLCERFGSDCIDRLLALGLLVDDGDDHADTKASDDLLRGTHWRPLSALSHAFSRWEGGNAREDALLARFRNLDELIAAHGPPPPDVLQRGLPGTAHDLPCPEAGPLDDVLLGRYTGRNYDPDASLPLATASRLLQRAFGAQGARDIARGTRAVKKTSPSAGSLHPIDCYVLAQRIDGVPTGLYHYQPLEHRLEPVREMEAGALRQLALTAVAGQDWFADAPMLLVLAARFRRNFWKYRNHPKAYRAVILDAGHLSQTFYLLATEAGMPAFITAAINEADIEAALGLRPMETGVLAVCGCGPGAAEAKTVEFRRGGQ
jgi:putative peptide maturation dehydrogenase